MVRRIRDCLSCNKRFISQSEAHKQCPKCQQNDVKSLDCESIPPIAAKNPRKRAREEPLPLKNDDESGTKLLGTCAVSPDDKPSNGTPSHSLTTERCEDGKHFEDDAKKQAAQEPAIIDLHHEDDDDSRLSICSEVESKDDDDDEGLSGFSDNMTLAEIAELAKKAPTNSPSVASAAPVAEEEPIEESFDVMQHLTVKNEGNEDVCFVCGKSLVGLALHSRVNHIKRCSRMHGVTARDLVVHDEKENFVDSTLSGSKNTVSNPYRKPNDWHKGANVDLDLAEPWKQVGNPKTMKDFYQVPVRSVNNALLAGAKRLATSAKLKAAAKEKQAKPGRGYKRRRPDFSNSPCPFYKRIPGTDFVCDGFVYARSALTKTYFLTHFHSDHYSGITKTWSEGTIYCSLPTANLVNQQLGVDKKYIHPLGLNTPTVIGSKGKPVKVTLLDANHCPGAVMFIFEVGRRKILHVGDFRWNREVMLQHPELRAFSSSRQKLDDIFLDTTYCEEKYSLPSQQQAIQAAVDLATREVEACRQGRIRLLMLFGSYTIGKERIYLSVAEKLGMKVCVDRRRHRVLSALGWPKEKMALLTTNPSQSCLWVVPIGHLNFKKMTSYLSGGPSSSNRSYYDRVVGFRPTGWSVTACGKKKKSNETQSDIVSTRSKGSLVVHSIPYSEHSSFPELVECLDCLKPMRIIPTVSVSKSDAQVQLLLAALKRRQGN